MKRCFQSIAQRRSGVALVELIVVITVSSVIVGIGISLISLLLKSQRDVGLGIRYAVSLSRLTDVLRDDIHRSLTARIASDVENSRLELELADHHVIAYIISGNRINRHEQRGEAVVHQDSFLFPAESRLQFEQETESRIIRLVLELSNRPTRLPQGTVAGTPHSTRVVQIAAALARDQRFAGRGP